MRIIHGKYFRKKTIRKDMKLGKGTGKNRKIIRLISVLTALLISIPMALEISASEASVTDELCFESQEDLSTENAEEVPIEDNAVEEISPETTEDDCYSEEQDPDQNEFSDEQSSGSEDYQVEKSEPTPDTETETIITEEELFVESSNNPEENNGDLLNDYLKLLTFEEANEEIVEQISSLNPDEDPDLMIADIISEISDEDKTELIEELSCDSVNALFGVSREENLTGMNSYAYDIVKSKAAAVADGAQASTEFTFTLPIREAYGTEIWYTAEQLGVASILDSSGKVRKEAINALFEKISWNGEKVVKSLLCDMPYELYWFDKTKYLWSQTYARKQEGGVTYLGYQNDPTMYIKMSIATGYHNGSPTNPSGSTKTYYFTANTEKTGAAKKTIEKAREIRNNAAALSDYEKLVYYRNTICSLVSYNSSVTGSTAYGDPWQVIYVFDEDPSTNVVCEGYSKAFKLLCDLSSFKDGYLESQTVTGYLKESGGSTVSHMWNIVRMDDGKRYLCDITNCDGSTVGAPDKLFLKGMAGSGENTYSIVLSKTLTYTYDLSTISLFTTDELALSSSDYAASTEDWGDITGEIRDAMGFASLNDIPTGVWVYGLSQREYSGAAQTFDNLKVFQNKALLTENTDYTLKYSSNINAGSGYVTVKGKGNLSGSRKFAFQISPRSLSEKDAYGNPLVSITDLTLGYNGRSQKKASAVDYKLADSYQALKKNKDYRLVFPSNLLYKDPGTYPVTVNGIGNYTGTTSYNIKIVSGSTLKTVSSLRFTKIPTQSASGNGFGGIVPIKPSITLRDGAKILKEKTDYTISYLNNDRIGTATVIITGIPESGYSGTRRESFTIKGKPIKKAEITGLIPMVYTGDPIEQKNYKVTMAGTQLIEGPDFEVTYENNIKAGKSAVICFIGKGAFEGKLKKKFTIEQMLLSGKNISIIASDSVTYSKGGTELPVTVKNVSESGSHTLIKGKDYTITYQNNKTAGTTANAVLKGKGNYSGSVTKVFRITQKEMNSLSVLMNDFLYTGKPGFKQSITITDTNGKTLKEGTDYDKNAIIYQNANTGERLYPSASLLTAGTAVTATVQGIGNYTGTAMASFRCVKSSIDKASIKVKSKQYTGQAVELNADDITMKVKVITLTSGVDYEIVSYLNNQKKGTAKVTLRGKGNFGGVRTVSFSIKAGLI